MAISKHECSAVVACVAINASLYISTFTSPSPQEVSLDCSWPLQKVLKLSSLLDYLLDFQLFEVSSFL